MKIKNGKIIEAEFIESSFYNERPDGVDIDMIVIHNISLPPGEFGHNFVQDFFTGHLDHSLHPFFGEIEGLEVSSHLYIDRQGKLFQFVPLHKRAWHAGVSSFGGQKNCNDFSVGIELEGSDTVDFEEIQYRTLVQVIKTLRENYSKIATERIVGHSDVAPGRKTDPGPCFDWNKLHCNLGYLKA